MTGLDLLGVDPLPTASAAPARASFTGMGIAVAAGTAGALLVRSHPVLAFLGFSAVAGNAHAVATKERTWKQAAERVGRHVVAVAGSLAMPKHPVVGYVAGAVAADLLLDDDKHSGILDEWAHYAGVREARPVTAEVVSSTKAALPAPEGMKR